jgi:hypothetical protein
MGCITFADLPMLSAIGNPFIFMGLGIHFTKRTCAGITDSPGRTCGSRAETIAAFEQAGLADATLRHDAYGNPRMVCAWQQEAK